MIDESAHRRPSFSGGPRVILADGGPWSLPLRDAGGDDPEYDGLLAMVVDSEDRAEVLRSEFALLIFLLTRNYDLTPEALETLLHFTPGDPAQSSAQCVVHEVARESYGRGRSSSTTRPATRHTQPTSTRPIGSTRKP